MKFEEVDINRAHGLRLSEELTLNNTILPKNHKVQDLSQEVDRNIIDDTAVLDNITTNKNFLNKKSSVKRILKQKYKDVIKNGILKREQGIPYLLHILTYRKGLQKIKIIKLFNITIFKYRKK